MANEGFCMLLAQVFGLNVRVISLLKRKAAISVKFPEREIFFGISGCKSKIS